MELVDRLKAVVAYSKLSERAFALNCGLKQPTLDKQLKGIRSISTDTIVGVCTRYPEISRDWLLVGEGEMLVEANTSKELERIEKLTGVVESLQEVIDAKNATIAALNERIKQLEELKQS